MKYLKRYNEELTPTTPENLKGAAYKAYSYDQPERSDTLRDYSDTKEFGVYKMDLYSSTHATIGEDLTFTEATFDNIVYGQPYSTNLNADTAVRNWSEGNNGNLMVSFDVCFRPTRETFNKIEHKFDIKNKEYKKQGSHFIPIENKFTRSVDGVETDITTLRDVKLPLFRMSVFLATEFEPNCNSCWGEGSIECQHCDGTGEEWYNGGDDVRDCPECENGALVCPDCNGAGYLEKISAPVRFKEDKCFILKIFPAELSKSLDLVSYKDLVLGIFSDTKSARKFQEDLPDIFNKSELKSKIMDLLSILHGGSKDIERVINLFYNIPKTTILPERQKITGPDAAKKLINSRYGKTIKQVPYKPGDDKDDDDDN